MNEISRDELKRKIDQSDDFKLVMTLNEWAFQATHIPGSINIVTPEKAAEMLEKNDEIVVYCSDPTCTASQMAYRFLEKQGYTNLRRYAGGLSDWLAAGYPLEGEEIG